MKIKFIAFDSFGVKSMCTQVKTKDCTITIDPGVAIETNSFPLPLTERARLVFEYENRIRKSCNESDIIIITHYHYDHYLVEKELYIGKKLFVKDYKKNINKSQKGRARELFELLGDSPKGINIADGKKFKIGKTIIRFTKPMYHGRKEIRLGYVVGVIIEDNNVKKIKKRNKNKKNKNKKLFFKSDIDGPIVDEYTDKIINENPDILIIDGPATYILGFMLSYKDFAKAVLNLKKIVEKSRIRKIVLDHHTLRDYRYKDYLKIVYDAAKKKGIVVKTAAEFIGKKPKVLEGLKKYGKTKWNDWKTLSLDDLKEMIKRRKRHKGYKD